MEPSMDGLSCLLAFDTDDPQFVRGFELGRLWGELRSDPEAEVTGYVHTSGAEMVLRMAEATRREVRSEELGEGWLSINFSEASDEE
jgi:hypothetical protein